MTNYTDRLTEMTRKVIILCSIGFILGVMLTIVIMHPTIAETRSVQSLTVSSDAIAPTAHIDSFTATVKHKAPKLPKCKEEDSDNCIWNAHTRGNHEGLSFIAYRGQVYYLDECAGEAIPNDCTPDSNN